MSNFAFYIFRLQPWSHNPRGEPIAIVRVVIVRVPVRVNIAEVVRVTRISRALPPVDGGVTSFAI